MELSLLRLRNGLLGLWRILLLRRELLLTLGNSVQLLALTSAIRLGILDVSKRLLKRRQLLGLTGRSVRLLASLELSVGRVADSRWSLLSRGERWTVQIHYFLRTNFLSCESDLIILLILLGSRVVHLWVVDLSWEGSQVLALIAWLSGLNLWRAELRDPLLTSGLGSFSLSRCHVFWHLEGFCWLACLLVSIIEVLLLSLLEDLGAVLARILVAVQTHYDIISDLNCCLNTSRLYKLQ